MHVDYFAQLTEQLAAHGQAYLNEEVQMHGLNWHRQRALVRAISPTLVTR